ncbi:Hypothetical protein FKW44_005577 [Caligus rogercresseyi]|uniref:Cold and drought-regulated protein CORA n=1 Tax=Caligus rogercresseyi TaxID=217165 RepID=A0A7T8QS46_CALRO|nr:Hypothetical protein FKW44_005577 [Caligus rogercresseyi]
MRLHMLSLLAGALVLLIATESVSSSALNPHHREKRTIKTIVDIFKNFVDSIFGKRGGRHIKQQHKRPRPGYGPPGKPSYNGGGGGGHGGGGHSHSSSGGGGGHSHGGGHSQGGNAGGGHSHGGNAGVTEAS